MTLNKKFRFSIDRGGTFTDIFCEVINYDNDNKNNYSITTQVAKLLSEDPNNYKDAPTEGIRRIMSTELGVEMPRNQPIPTSQIDSIRMGTIFVHARCRF